MRFSGLALGAAAIAVAGLISASAPASAVSLAPLKPLTAGQSMVEKTHGWHRLCRRGFTDWHRHIPGVGRVTCASRRCYINRWGVRRCVHN
jgi:hypothetical protein